MSIGTSPGEAGPEPSFASRPRFADGTGGLFEGGEAKDLNGKSWVLAQNW